MIKSKKNEMDMCKGPIAKKMLVFSLPLIATMILQQLFNTADLIVVGSFGRPGALAAVGSTTTVITLLISVFNGISIGAGIIVARHYGAKEYDRVNKCVGTSVVISFIFGITLCLIAQVFAKDILQMMDTPSDIIDDAALYLRLYFLGVPFMLLYNFSASILRAVGDSKRTLKYITVAGVINVCLNLVFVLIFDMNVAGVAIATTVSQIISSLLCIKFFMSYDGCLKLDLKNLKTNKTELRNILTLGIPTGIQNSMYSISNLIIQISLNSFSSVVVSGNTAAQNIESYIFFVMNSISAATTTFASQNFGAGQIRRIRKVTFISLAFVCVSSIPLSFGIYFFGENLLKLYTKVPDEIAIGLIRFAYVGTIYFLCGIMDVLSGVLKGVGKTLSTALVSVGGICVFRIAWVYTAFEKYRTLPTLYLSYALSWIICIVVFLVMTFYYLRKHIRLEEEK